MIFNMSGGGTPLKFKVLGGSEPPASPAENTIWVNTDIKISAWAFQGAKPSTPVEGMIWFETDKTSVAELVAVDNGRSSITIAPSACLQYVNGAWAAKTAQTYKDGAWTPWRLYLYDKGDQRTDITGAWTGKNWGQYNGGNHTIGANYIIVHAGIGSQTASNYAVLPSNGIDLTHINTLYVNITSISTTTTTARHARFGISNTNVYTGSVAYTSFTGKTGVISLDVSAYSGVYYPYVHVYSNAALLPILSVMV